MRKKNNLLKDDYSWDLVGIGASTMDYLVKAPSFPLGREVHEALASARDGGGPVSTALCAASRLGARTAMLDVIGQDRIGEDILADFDRYGVDTQGIDVLVGYQSGCAHILVNGQTGDRAIYFEKSTAPELTHLSEAHKRYIQETAVLHINGRHRDVLLEAIAYAHSVGTLVSLDGGADRYSPFLDQVASQTDICIVALDFGEKYAGTSDLAQICRYIRQRGSRIAGVTAGARGSYVIGPDGTEYAIPAYPVQEVIDSTGCGDSYHGAFLYAFTHGYDVATCGKIASLVGSMNTQTLGGRSGLPSLKEVLQRV